jgi:hypothetical protein
MLLHEALFFVRHIDSKWGSGVKQFNEEVLFHHKPSGPPLDNLAREIAVSFMSTI